MRPLPVFISALLCALVSVSSFAAEMESFLDLPYGPAPRQKLDIYKAKGDSTKRPVVLWIHGGGWLEGDKREMPQGIGTLASNLVVEGFVAVSCNYRYSTTDKHPAQVDDVQRVVRWLRANADKYGLDRDRIGAIGLSAGGVLSAVLAVRDTREKFNDALDPYSSRVQVAVSFAGPTDLREDPVMSTPVIRHAASSLISPTATEKELADASPITFVSTKSSPILFVVGTEDPWVPNAHGTRMAEALKNAGVVSEVVVLQGEGHGLWAFHPKAAPAGIRFLKQHLKTQSGQ